MITWCSTGNGGARKLELFQINDGNGISNYRSQMTAGSARRDSLIWWCKQQQGILYTVYSI
jgi:hypothetical protein